ncbi:MAG TPA: nucleoside hydrolase [Cellulomonas sp.]
MANRMVIDSDTAADDCFAIMVGLRHPSASLEAVTIVAGNVPFPQQVENALLTMDACHRTGSTPLYEGAARPLFRPWHGASAHGDGKGNHDFTRARGHAEQERAVSALLRIVDENPGEIDLVTIGPLTNVAMAVAQDRDFVRKVRSLTIMGGCDDGIGNITAAAEYNFWVDPEATRVVLEAGFYPTIVSWTLVREQALWDDAMLERIAGIDSDMARFFTIVNRPNRVHNETVGLPGSTHPDSLTAMLVVRPDLVLEASDAYVAVETAGELTRGYSLMDRRRDRHEPNARVVDRIDAEGFYAAMVELLGTV